MPLKIDPLYLEKSGTFSRVLVDVDYSLSERVLVLRKLDSFKCYAQLYYEFVPFFCHACSTLGHKVENYRRREKQQEDNGINGAKTNSTRKNAPCSNVSSIVDNSVDQGTIQTSPPKQPLAARTGQNIDGRNENLMAL